MNKKNYNITIGWAQIILAIISIIVIVAIAVCTNYFTIMNSINQRFDEVNKKMSELNREVGEIRTELDCCEKYYLNP